MENDSAEQSNISKPWLFKKGQSGNPSGKKKGIISLKTYAQRMIQEMTERERQNYLDGLPKSFIWEMAEGKAVSKIEGDVNVKIEKLEAIQGATKTILNG